MAHQRDATPSAITPESFGRAVVDGHELRYSQRERGCHEYGNGVVGTGRFRNRNPHPPPFSINVRPREVSGRFRTRTRR